MQPRKTALAHSALQSHRAPLDMRQRRVLIMADGERTLQELTLLLGPDTPVLVRQLCEGGYLSGPAAPPDTTRALPAAAQSVATPVPAARASGPRRSLAAARLYVLGMLELQRNELAAHLHRQLQAAHDDAATLMALLEAVRQLPRMTTASYAQRVHQRLAEVLPEERLPALQALEISSGASAG